MLKTDKYLDIIKHTTLTAVDLILIKDNGIGLLNLNKKDLLKPYYTTKKNGSGLGLSIVNKIILDHNGSLKLSNTTKGAKVELFFSI